MQDGEIARLGSDLPGCGASMMRLTTMGADSKKSIPRSVREEAARQIYERHLDQLKQIIRNHVDARIRRRVGTSDILQSAIKSFCESDRVTADPEHILPRLLVFVKRKCLKAVRRHAADKRDFNREIPLEIGDFDVVPPESANILDPAGLKPEEEAIIHEELERLDDESLIAILMHVAGQTNKEIGRAIGRSEETARQRIIRVVNHWKSQLH
jgi:RNA polymerase sigma factor (sigma-70 family)